MKSFMWFKMTEMSDKILVSNYSVETSVSRMVKCLLVICFTAAVLLCQRTAAIPRAAPLPGPSNAQSCAVSQDPVANFFLVGTGTVEVS